MAIDSPYVRIFILTDRNGRQIERPSLIVSLITCRYAANVVKTQEHKIMKTKHGELIRMLLPRRINNASFQVGGAVM